MPADCGRGTKALRSSLIHRACYSIFGVKKPFMKKLHKITNSAQLTCLLCSAYLFVHVFSSVHLYPATSDLWDKIASLRLDGGGTRSYCTAGCTAESVRKWQK